MSQCSDCYNGCTEITSDKCVKYTGVDVPALDIKTGDSLSWVEQALISFLMATIDGSGIQITLEESDYCDLVSGYLQECETVTALDLFRALTKAACDLQSQVIAAQNAIHVIEADYDVECLDEEVDAGTHSILQAVITKLCALEVTVTALAEDLDTNYVKIADFNSLADAWFASETPSSRYYTKMIPYVAMEYYGPLTNFDATGAGIVDTEWEQVYLCNGDNGTPDKRGRVAVGATSTPGVLPMDAAVDPANPANPAYTVSDTAHGANTIVLDETQIPAHTHPASSSVDPNPHSHSITGTTTADWPGSGYVPGVNLTAPESAGDTDTTELVVTTTVDENDGGGLAHDNYQPGIGAYYIMYIPN